MNDTDSNPKTTAETRPDYILACRAQAPDEVQYLIQPDERRMGRPADADTRAVGRHRACCVPATADGITGGSDACGPVVDANTLTDARTCCVCAQPSESRGNSCLRYTVIDGMCLDHAGLAGYFKPA